LGVYTFPALRTGGSHAGCNLQYIIIIIIIVLGKFYDVAKVAMTITGRFSHIWLQAKNKGQIFMLFYIFLATYLNHV
jgi:hypothetical protein